MQNDRSGIQDPLGELYDFDSAGQEFSLTEDEAIFIILRELDYKAQLSAVHDLLQQQKNTDQLLKDKIEEADAFAKRTSGLLNYQAVEDWLAHLHASTYQDAAHSMAAVGMLAPLMESIFCQSFSGIRRILETNTAPFSSHPRWQWSAAEQWDCHFVWKNGRRAKNLVEGILQLAETVGLSAHLPDDIGPTLQALFAYRNNMFHWGFEWPVVEREKFQQRIKTANWPKDWFEMATSDHRPWIFYLTDTFIHHCLTTIDSVLRGLGAFALVIRD